MARVDYTGVPQVQAEGEAPNDTQHIEANPNAFGAQIAQGIGDVGAGLGDAVKFYDNVASTDAVNTAIAKGDAILRGDPNKTVIGSDGQPAPDTGYFGKHGADAMSSHAETQQQLANVFSEGSASLSTPQSKLAYETTMRRYLSQWQNEMGSHYDQQAQAWGVQTNENSIALTQNQIAAHLNNPDALAQDKENLRQSFVRRDQIQYGSDPKVAEGAVLRADQTYYTTQIRTAVGLNDGVRAQKALDDGAEVLGSLPNYDQIVHSVKETLINSTMAPAMDKFVSDALGSAQSSVGLPIAGSADKPSPEDVSAAIGGQEWHGTGPAPTSVNGAVGPSQIKPATAIQYGLDPTRLSDPAYAKQARDVIISKIAALPNVQGDPARIAVGYFSGPGNIAPLDSPTPYLHDHADGNGKTTSSYVADVLGRVQKYPSTADAINANMTGLLDKARTQAEQLFPNYPDAQERFVQGAERRLTQVVSQQRQQYEVDTHVVQSEMSSDHPPISEQELLARSPQVATAWLSMQVNNPYGAMGVERMFDANAKGPAVTYGTGFKDYLDRALGPTNSPDRITNASQLWPYVGPGNDAALTNTGVNQLSAILSARGTPQGEAFAAQVKTFVDQAHAELTFSNKGAGQVDPKGEARFSQYMATALPTLLAAQKNGTLDKVLNPKSPDYIGNSMQTFARTPSQIMHDRLFQQSPMTKYLLELGAPEQGRYLLKEAVDQGRLTVQQASQIGEERGYFAKPKPAQPPTPSIPAPVGGF